MKAQVLAECAAGSSVAKVAMAHGINANIVHRWRKLARDRNEAGQQPEFIPVTLTPAAHAVTTRDIRLELRRGSLSIDICWPLDAAGKCAAWLREMLR